MYELSKLFSKVFHDEQVTYGANEAVDIGTNHFQYEKHPILKSASCQTHAIGYVVRGQTDQECCCSQEYDLVGFGGAPSLAFYLEEDFEVTNCDDDRGKQKTHKNSKEEHPPFDLGLHILPLSREGIVIVADGEVVLPFGHTKQKIRRAAEDGQTPQAETNSGGMAKSYVPVGMVDQQITIKTDSGNKENRSEKAEGNHGVMDFTQEHSEDPMGFHQDIDD